MAKQPSVQFPITIPKQPSSLLPQRTFRTKAALQEFCREILYTDRLSPEQQRFMLTLVHGYHPNGVEKIGNDNAIFGGPNRVVGIYAGDSGRGNLCFYIARSDGTEIDFSFLKCPSAPDPRRDAASAFRDEVEDDVQRWRRKRQQEVTHDEVTGAPLGKHVHVDHAAPLTFIVLRDRFLESKGLDLADVEVLPGQQTGTRNMMIDRDLAGEWRTYHNANAVLRLVNRHTNLSTLRRESTRRVVKSGPAKDRDSPAGPDHPDLSGRLEWLPPQHSPTTSPPTSSSPPTPTTASPSRTMPSTSAAGTTTTPRPNKPPGTA